MELELFTEFDNIVDVVDVKRLERDGGLQVLVTFANGYVASVVSHQFSYGVEMAVMYGERLVYDTPVTDDVLPHLDEDSLMSALIQTSQLPLRKAIG